MSATADKLPLRIRADRIYTGEEVAEAILIRDGQVVVAGSDSEVPEPAGGATLDLTGLVLTPGLTDAHIHLVEWALARRQIDLRQAGSPDEAARIVAEAAASRPDPEWIRGRGWNPHIWSGEPHRSLLDEAAGGRPVLLQSMDMHSLWASTEALRRAGIGADTPDPEGGRIERDERGEPTGVVRDNAMPLLYDVAPAPDDAMRRSALLEAQEVLHAYGVVGVHTVEPDSLGLLDAVRQENRLRLRVLQHLPLAKLDEAIRLGLRSGFGGPWLRIGGVKMFLDGALGSCTAWLREPYEGTDRDRGVSTLPPAEFRDVVTRGAEAGLAMTVHAIGDAAVELAIETLAAAPPVPIPHRIEHAQLIAPEFLESGRGLQRLVCSVQPAHIMDDWRPADRHWGDRSRWAYAFRSLEEAGCTLALGSDAPVGPPDPREALYAAVTRRDRAGEPDGGWYPEERLSMERAWAGHTVGAARAAGDDRQGRLEPGCFADLVAWATDPFEAEPEELLDLRTVLTMVGGEVVWRE